jgi:hypothetical protein
MDISVMNAGHLAKIQPRYPSNTSLECYCHATVPNLTLYKNEFLESFF